jgi:hypothetical protein
MDTTRVAGEPIDTLLQALLKFQWSTPTDGMMHFKVKLEPELAVPFNRALMRVDAELLLQDADQLTPENARDLRTDDQRHADALVALALRVTDAADVLRTG